MCFSVLFFVGGHFLWVFGPVPCTFGHVACSFSPEDYPFVLVVSVVVVGVIVGVVVVVVGVIVIVVGGVIVLVVALMVADWGSVTAAAGLSFAGHRVMVAVLGEVWLAAETRTANRDSNNPGPRCTSHRLIGGNNIGVNERPLLLGVSAPRLFPVPVALTFWQSHQSLPPPPPTPSSLSPRSPPLPNLTQSLQRLPIASHDQRPF